MKLLLFPWAALKQKWSGSSSHNTINIFLHAPPPSTQPPVKGGSYLPPAVAADMKTRWRSDKDEQRRGEGGRGWARGGGGSEVGACKYGSLLHTRHPFFSSFSFIFPLFSHSLSLSLCWCEQQKTGTYMFYSLFPKLPSRSRYQNKAAPKKKRGGTKKGEKNPPNP